MISEAELAWLAGFLDGEGYIGIRKRRLPTGNPRYTISLDVSHTKREAVEFLQATIGGSIQQYQRKKGWKTTYKWRVRDKKAQEIIKQLLPYFKLKQEQAKLALELADHSNPFQHYHILPRAELNRREQIYQRMRILNKTGQLGLQQGSQIKLPVELERQRSLF